MVESLSSLKACNPAKWEISAIWLLAKLRVNKLFSPANEEISTILLVLSSRCLSFVKCCTTEISASTLVFALNVSRSVKLDKGAIFDIFGTDLELLKSNIFSLVSWASKVTSNI